MAEEADDLPPENGAENEELAPENQGAGEGGEEQSQDSPRTSSDVEDLAREMGWAPKDQWRGDPEKWKDASSFLRATVEINRTLSKDVRGLKDTVDRLSRTSAKIAERTIQEERERAAQRFAEATEAGDAQAAWQASQELHRIDSQPTEAAADPLADFRDRNPWYDKDPEARAYAFAVGEMHKGKPADEVFRLAEEAVKKRFPEHFEQRSETQRQQQRAPMVNSPGPRSSRPTPKEKGVGDLPPEARKAGEDFVRRGRIGSLADYAKIYFEENA